MTDSPKVAVPLAAIAAVGAVMAALLVTLGFLLGERSASNAQPTVIVQAPAMPSPSPGVGAPAPAVALRAAPGPSTATSGPGPGTAVTTTPQPPQLQPDDGDAKARAEVAKYFRDLDAALESGELPFGFEQEPEKFAMAALKDSVEGDGKALDGVARAVRVRLESVASVYAPLACDKHKDLTLDLLRQSDRMLTTLTASIRSHNMDSLGDIAATGQRLSDQTKQADAMAKSIKERFGLPTG